MTCALAMILLLSGCSSGNAAYAVFTQFRETLNGMESLSITAGVNTDYGSYVFDCTLALKWNSESNSAEITVIEPESVAGIRAVLTEGKWKLGADTVLRGAGDIENRTLAPLTALYKMLCAWQSAPVTSSCLDEVYGKSAVRITLGGEQGEDTVQDVWIEQGTLLPLRAEIAEGGKTIHSARFIYDT